MAPPALLRSRDRAAFHPLRPALFALAASLVAAASHAQSPAAPPDPPAYPDPPSHPDPNVIIDWSALTALDAAPAGPPSATITLHPPPRPPAVASVLPRGKPVASAAPAEPAAPASPVPSVAPAPSSAVPAARPPAAALASAAVPATAALAAGRLTTVRFTRGQSQLPPDAQDILNSVAARLAADGKERLQLLAYASGTGDDAVEARRLSLARAVELRTYLIAKGVLSVRMDVRALGSRNDGGPADSVDLVILDH